MNDEIKNKPNSNPIQSQYKPNTKPIQTQYRANTKPIQTQLVAAWPPPKPEQGQLQNVERLLVLESIIAIIICLE